MTIASPGLGLAKLAHGSLIDIQRKANERKTDQRGVSMLGSLDVELKQRQIEKYDSGAESEVREWVLKLIGQELEEDLFVSLKSGVILCEIANKISPGSIKQICRGKMPFMMMENINLYLRICKEKFGIPSTSSFQTVDLFEAKNMNAVLVNLHTLGRLCSKIPGFDGPSISSRRTL